MYGNLSVAQGKTTCTTTVTGDQAATSQVMHPELSKAQRAVTFRTSGFFATLYRWYNGAITATDQSTGLMLMTMMMLQARLCCRCLERGLCAQAGSRYACLRGFRICDKDRPSKRCPQLVLVFRSVFRADAGPGYVRTRCFSNAAYPRSLYAGFCVLTSAAAAPPHSTDHYRPRLCRV
jgi:hypothetical protein